MKRLAIHLSILFQLFALSNLPALAAPATTTAAPDSPASLMTKGLSDSNTTAGYTALPIPLLVGRMIGLVIGLIGMVFVVKMVQAGILYMTAAGDGKKVDEAKKIIVQSIIGIVLVIAAYAISSFVINQLATATS